MTLTAPPVRGAANKALREFIAERLGISKRAVILQRGEKLRDKVVRLVAMTPQEVKAKLMSAGPGQNACRES